MLCINCQAAAMSTSQRNPSQMVLIPGSLSAQEATCNPMQRRAGDVVEDEARDDGNSLPGAPFDRFVH